MRVLHTEASLGWGGQEIRILSEARGVARRGHEVLLAAAPDSRILKEATRFGVEGVELPIGRKRLAGVGALRKLLRARAFDVINTHSSTDAWLVALAARGAGAPVTVRTRHISAPIPGDPFTRWLYTRATARVVTTGERLREQVMREVRVAAGRVVSIPTGIDLQRFTPADRAAVRARLGLPLDAPLVGIVATLRSWKGHTFLFDALAASTHTDAQLVVVGDGPQREALEAQAKEGPLAGRVRFVGNQDDVAPWMQALDLFCLPSYANEGVPQSLMQAMACGIAVISTPVGSIDEIVTDGDTGLMVTPRDAAALGNAIDRLLGDLPMRQALGERAHRVAHDRFGEDRMVDRMLAVFDDARRAPRHG